MPPAPRKTAAPATAVAGTAVAAPTVTDGSKYAIRFGIILDINGTAVPITSADVTNALTNGVEFTLQQPITLPTIAEFQTWVNDKFKVKLPDATALPTPLNTVVSTITDMKVTVEKLHLKVPGSKDTDGVQFTIEANGAFQDEIVLIKDTLGIQGFVFGFSNEPPPAAP